MCEWGETEFICMNYRAGLADSVWEDGDSCSVWVNRDYRDSGQGDFTEVGLSRVFEGTKKPWTIGVPKWSPVQGK
jgi:hypothetical protein